MKPAIILTVLTVVAAVEPGSSALRQAGKDDASAKALEKLQGKWIITSSILDGNPFSMEKLKDRYLVIQGSTVTFFQPDMPKWSLTLKINAKENPPHYDFILENGQTLEGIYKLEGDLLTLCADAAGKARPTAFHSKAGSGWLLNVLKRSK